MLAPFWLAVAGLPVFHRPFPEMPDQPAAIALAAGEVSLRRPCLRLRCAGAEWQGRPAASTYAYRGDDQPTVRSVLPGKKLAGGIGLSAPASRREWTENYLSNAGIGAGYGMQAVQRPDTKLQVEVGPGYRLQPYVNDGTAAAGPVARGKIELQQQLGQRARLDQRVQVETGRENTVIRNSLGVTVQLQPQWTLDSDLEVRHDSASDDGKASTEGNVKLRYAF